MRYNLHWVVSEFSDFLSLNICKEKRLNKTISEIGNKITYVHELK